MLITPSKIIAATHHYTYYVICYKHDLSLPRSKENDIKTAGLMALSLALKVNQNITRLDVDRDTKKESVIPCAVDCSC